MVSRAKIEAMRRRQKEVETGRDFDSELTRYKYLNHEMLEKHGMMVYTPKELNKFIIIDHVDSDDHWSKKIHLHRGMGASYIDVLCPTYHEKGRTCPICQLRTKLKKQGADEETLRQLSSYTFRSMFFILDMTDAETKSFGVQVYPAAKTVEELIFEQSDDQDGEIVYIADPEHPCLITFRYIVKGSGGYPDYKGLKVRQMKNALPSKYLKNLPMLDELLVNSNDEFLSNLVDEVEEPEVENEDNEGMEDDEDDFDDSEDDFDDEDDDELEVSKKGSKKKSEKKAVEESEDDEDDDFEFDGEEVATKKKSKKSSTDKKKKKAVEDEDFDEEELELDEDEEEDEDDDLPFSENEDEEENEDEDDEEDEKQLTAKQRLQKKAAEKKQAANKSKKRRNNE